MHRKPLSIAVLPGDGVGPEVIAQAVRVLRALGDVCGLTLEFKERPIGGIAIRQSGEPLPQETLATCLKSSAVLLGAVGGAEFDELPPERRPEAGLLQLRRELGGFANIRPARFYPALAGCSPLRAEILRNADLVIVRELLGGLYFGSPRGISKNGDISAVNTMRYTAEEIERLVRVGFKLARQRRRKLTSVDKANVLETSRLWRDVVNRIAPEFPDVKVDHVYVDACAMYLVTNPARFDVIVTENLFGDVLSDEAAALTGSLGMLGSATLGGSVNLYEPVHGSAPDIAGKDVANPLGAIASAAMLVRHSFGMELEAGDIEAAIEQVLALGYRTADIAAAGGKMVGTAAMGARVEHAVLELLDRRCAYHAV